MKTIRAIIYLLAFLTASILLALFLGNFINRKLDQYQTNQATTASVISSTIATPKSADPTAPSTNSPTTDTTAQTVVPVTITTPIESTSTTTQPAVSATPASSSSTSTTVTTIKLASGQSSFSDFVGTIKSKNTISVFPGTSATIQKVNFQEGDYVKKGDTLVELTGSNLTEHPTQKQLKIAQTTYDNAKTALDNLVATNTESLKTAQLQVQSALSQASAIPYDLKSIEQNQSGLQDGLNLIQNSLFQTRDKNNRDRQNAQQDLTNLVQSLNQAQDDRASLINQINNLQYQINNQPRPEINSTQVSPPVPVVDTSLQTQLAKLQATLATKEKAISDLYTSIDKARLAYSNSINSTAIGENTILGQIQQSGNQLKVLDLTLQSTKTKLGYTGDTSDALKLAEQSYNATRTQLQSAVDNAQNQLKIAKLNLELTQDLASALLVKAPVAGVITSLNLSPGQTVNPQTSVVELIDPQTFQLEINVDPSLADQISEKTLAQILLGGKWLEVPIKSISPKVDDKTKQVKVVLQMPNIFFRINQIIKAKLPISSQSNGQLGSVVIPLDAVTIATENSFVYVNDHGKAKRVIVKTGQINGDQIEILEGLNSQDEVILNGAKNLTDGQAISLQ